MVFRLFRVELSGSHGEHGNLSWELRSGNPREEFSREQRVTEKAGLPGNSFLAGQRISDRGDSEL